MPVIDVDSHYYEPFSWLADTDAALAAELPDIDKVTLVITTAFGEVLSTLPPELKPDPLSRIPKELMGGATELTPELIERGEMLLEWWLTTVAGAHKPEDRIKFCDEQGIDQQFVLPTFAFNPISLVRREMPDKTPRILSAYNTWTCNNLAGHTDRLIPAGVVDLKTMTRAEIEAEFAKLRAGGSRVVLFWPAPVEGKSIAHPDYEWFWAGAADHGLMPMVHVGAGRPNVDLGWLNNGREFPSSLVGYFAQLHQIPELVLSELVASGMFDRYPNLRVIVSELGVDWLPTFMRRLDALAKAGKADNAWAYDLLPSAYMRRQVRVSPLEFDPIGRVIEEGGEGIVVFASDYPHPEGGQNAVATQIAKLGDKVSADARDGFLGGTIAKDLALTA
ncbi:MAG TPA: amidohydrolase family protein [Acidimicrobiales bacterium]|nr:amidohydrolase family protein [Acidimicrobiales bacterium]